MNSKQVSTSLSLTFAILSLPSATVAASTHTHTHADPHWTYEEQKKWGTLVDPIYHPKFPYAECGVGQKQSPVNIEEGNVVNTDDIDELQANYIDIPLSLSNNGHTLRVNVPAGTLRIGRTAYDLLQYHFHAPSEHHLNGRGYPMEVHFVHGTVDGRIAVVGVFLQAGRFNEDFQKILDAAPHKSGTTVQPPLSLNPRRFLPDNLQHFYTYAGSLTTPPCTEGVQWYVLSEPIQVSGEQIQAFQQRYYHGNVRVAQKLHGRYLLAH